MLLSSSTDLEARRRQALGKVYALLIRLAEEQEKQTAPSDNFANRTGKLGDAICANGQDPYRENGK